MSLLEKLKAGPRNVRVIKFPGTDQDVGLRILTNAEKQAAVFAAEEHFKKKEIEISAITLDAFEDERTTQILAIAMRDPEDPEKSFAKNAGELRGLITTDEKDILAEEYNAFETEVSPSAENMSDEETEALFETLKKSPETGNALSSVVLKRLITFLASRQLSLQKANGSISIQ